MTFACKDKKKKKLCFNTLSAQLLTHSVLNKNNNKVNNTCKLGLCFYLMVVILILRTLMKLSGQAFFCLFK